MNIAKEEGYLRLQIMDMMIARSGWTSETAPTKRLGAAVAELASVRNQAHEERQTQEWLEERVLLIAAEFMQAVQEATKLGL